jgi:hypothetical protein
VKLLNLKDNSDLIVDEMVIQTHALGNKLEISLSNRE